MFSSCVADGVPLLLPSVRGQANVHLSPSRCAWHRRKDPMQALRKERFPVAWCTVSSYEKVQSQRCNEIVIMIQNTLNNVIWKLMTCIVTKLSSMSLIYVYSNTYANEGMIWT